MKRRFVVVTDPTTIEQDKVLQEWIEPRFNWWHWLDQTWLLVDNEGKIQSREIRDKLEEVFPGVNCLVLQFDPTDDTWSGFGPGKGKDDIGTKGMFRWLHNNWNK